MWTEKMTVAAGRTRYGGDGALPAGAAGDIVSVTGAWRSLASASAWRAEGRRVRDGVVIGGVTIDEIINAYWKWAQGYYSPSHQYLVKTNLRLLRKYFGGTPAAAFGPNNLRLLREEMTRGDPTGDPPRRPW